LGEVWTEEIELAEEGIEPVEPVLPVKNINAWLAQQSYSPLENLNQYVNTGKVMGTRIYGGAYNFLRIWEFIEVVKAQSWQEPQNVQLLIQDEPDERFTLYTLSD
jgi:hypothetical protein